MTPGIRRVLKMRKEAIREMEDSIHTVTEIDPNQFKTQKGPVATIYLPLHHESRGRRQDDQDRIELKDLAKKAEDELLKQYDKEDIQGIVDRLDFIITHEDLDMWRTEAKGMGILTSNDECYVYLMDGAPSAIVEVGDKFDMAPIFGEAVRDEATHYKMLLLSSDYFELLDGDANSIHFVKFPDDVKHYFAETYPEFDGETTPLDYYSLEDHESPFHDHKSRNDVTQEETTKFFRYVNKAISEKLLKDNTVPVILVTLPEHVNEFEKICSIQLFPKVIEKDPNGLTGKQLREMAVELISK